MAQFDIYNIEQRLREWDESILRIDWDKKRRMHRIVCQDKNREEYIAMTVKEGELDARVVFRMMEINPKRGYNPFDEIDEAQNAKEKREESKISDMAYSMADMLHKPLTEHALYGR